MEKQLIQSDVTVIGAGPAGLTAAIESAKAGAKVFLIDENSKAGGQLFKQIHKFFGSSEHYAGIRGIDIGEKLCEEAAKLKVNMELDTVAFQIFNKKTVNCLTPEGVVQFDSNKIILAAGAIENTLPFKGWTKPGVMAAGAAQTMTNINRVLPGKRALMVGSGNVGLIVAYQLLQAGVDVVGIVEALPNIGGYGVHSAKVKRAGVPIFTNHSVIEAKSKDDENEVSSVVIGEINSNFDFIKNTEKEFEVDTICLAVGLSPLAELAWMAGCKFKYIPELGGFIPGHNDDMKTTVDNIYVAGDITGVEEASTAIEEGRLAGIAATDTLGLISAKKAEDKKKDIRKRLFDLRMGPFGAMRQTAKERLMEGF